MTLLRSTRSPRPLKMARAPSEFRERVIDRFPDYGGLKVLDHQLRFLFPEAAEA
jgi:hypothetical protein